MRGGYANAVLHRKLFYSGSEAAAGQCDDVTGTRNPEPETRHPKPENRNPKAEADPLRADQFLFSKSPPCTYTALLVEIGAVHITFRQGA